MEPEIVGAILATYVIGVGVAVLIGVALLALHAAERIAGCAPRRTS